MKKLKVYLDTSVISHLTQEDVPEKMADTIYDVGNYRRCYGCSKENCRDGHTFTKEL